MSYITTKLLKKKKVFKCHCGIQVVRDRIVDKETSSRMVLKLERNFLPQMSGMEMQFPLVNHLVSVLFF